MDIMVCFQKDCIQIFQILHCIIVIFPKICCNCYGLPTLFNTIPGRFICIMGNSKWMHIQFTKLKWVIRLDWMQKSFRHLSKTGRFFDSCNRSRSRVNRDLVLSAKHTKSLNMIRMFMCDQNSIEFVPFNLQLIQTFFNSFLTNPRINQKMGIITSYIDTVSTAAACNTAHSHLFNLSPICLFVASKSPLLSITTVHAFRNTSSTGCEAIILVIFSSV